MHGGHVPPRPHAYLPCQECGPVQVPFDQLRRWVSDVPGFFGALAAAAAITGPATEVGPGRLWRLGKARWAGRSREVFLARNLDTESRAGVIEALSRHPKAVLFLPTEDQVGFWSASTPNTVVALESMLMLTSDGLHFDQEYLESRLAELPAPTRPKLGTKKRGSRSAKIEKLTQEISEHLRAAYDYAFSTLDRTGTPQLLPRPSQKELAERTGLSETDVSRCLKDEAAKELRIYWETALDLGQIMRWQGGRPVRRLK
jgi:hypothetical protein